MTTSAHNPVEVILIDDNLDFLETFGAVLSLPEGCELICFRDVKFALAYVNNPKDTPNTLERNGEMVEIKAYKKNQLGGPPMPLAPRANDILAIICDRYMPQMDGMDFFHQVKDRNIKRILLTGMLDDGFSKEIEAKKLVHKFISKGWHNDLKCMQKTISTYYEEFCAQRGMAIAVDY